MKIISWLLILCFTTNVFARSVEHNLASTVEEFKYELTVDWDQKDQEALKSILSRMRTELSKLKASGMTGKDLIQYVEKNGNPEQVARIRTQLMLNEANMSEERLTDFFRKEVLPVGSTGASWNGGSEIKYGLAALALIGILVLLAMKWSKYTEDWNNSTCITAEKYESCGEEYVCDLRDEYRDEYGTIQSTCVAGHYETVCNIYERCLQWEGPLASR